MNARPRHCWRLLLGAAVAWSLAVAVPVAPNGVAAAGLPASVCPSSGRCSDPVLQQYRSGQPEPRVRTVPAAIQAGAFSNPDTYLPKLAAYLKGGSSDPFLQVKALHDWVAVNIAYDANAFFSGQLGSGDATQALKSHKAVCAGYSGLLKRLLDLAGFNNREVSGYGRGWGSDALSAEHVSSNHAWTAVQIRGAWYLVDSTWDAGYIDNGRSFVWHYSDDYLYLNPSYFLYTHMPDNPSDQLLGKPLTQQQFLALPKLDGLFWTMGLRPLSPLQHVTSAGAEAVLRLQVPDGVQVQGELSDQQGKAQPLRSMVSFLKGQAEIHISFPAAGRWQVSIFAGPKGATQFAGVALLGFSAGAGSSLVYPTLYTSWYAAGCALVAPSSTPVAGQATRFALRVPGAQDVFLSQNNGMDRTELQRDATDPALFSATYTPQPSGAITVFALIPSLGSTATGLLQYS